MEKSTLFDFEQDLKLEIFDQFNYHGMRLPIKARLGDYLLDYLTVSKKLVRRAKRRVLYSPELKTSLSEHPKQKEIIHLQGCFERGDEINFFQSKRLFQSSFHDHLVYEWNIFHFHLSLEREKKGKFAKQVKQLLFVFISSDTAIFLGTDNHSDGAFGNVSWQEVLHNHFPESIAQHRDNQISNVGPELDSMERQTLWDKGYTLGLTKVGDTMYHSPGIGRSTTGHSMLVLKQHSAIMRWFYLISEQFADLYVPICQFLDIDVNAASFHIRFGDRTLEVFESMSKRIVITYPEVVDENMLES